MDLRTCCGQFLAIELCHAMIADTQVDDATPLGGVVGEAAPVADRGQLGLVDSRRRRQSGGPTVAEGDGTGLVHQQGVDVTGRLDRATRHGQDVALHKPIHTGDADGGQQRADGGRDQADQQRDQFHRVRRLARVLLHRPDGHHRHQEDDRETREQDVQGDLVGCLLTGRSLDEGDHPVHKGLAGRGGDPHDDLVREHHRATGHRRPVATGFAYHGGGFAGDRRLVDRRDAVHHITVAGDDLAGLDDDEVTDLQVPTGHLDDLAVCGQTTGHRVTLHFS